MCKRQRGGTAAHGRGIFFPYNQSVGCKIFLGDQYIWDINIFIFGILKNHQYIQLCLNTHAFRVSKHQSVSSTVFVSLMFVYLYCVYTHECVSSSWLRDIPVTCVQSALHHAKLASVR